MNQNLRNKGGNKMKRVLTVLSISLLITAVFSGCDKTERKCMNGYVYELPENGTHWMITGEICGEEIK